MRKRLPIKRGLTIWVYAVLFLGLSSGIWGCRGGEGVSRQPPARPGLETRKKALQEKIAGLRDEPVSSTEAEVHTGYQHFLTRHTGPALKLRAPALKRLGDLHMKKAHEQFLSDMQSYDSNPDGPPPVVDYQQAVSAYTELLRNHPQYPENDQVLYALARAYDEMGEKQEALPLLEWLVKSYPESPHLLEAHFRLGEYYFDRKEYRKAAAVYDKTVLWEDPFFQEKALFKLAWTYFKLQSYLEAVDHFLAVVDQKTQEMETFSPEEGSLVWESLSYVTTAFQRLGGPVPMTAYFRNKGHRRYEKDLYLMMGNRYMVEKNTSSGIETYRAFKEAHPLDPMAPFFTAYVLDALEKSGKTLAAQAERINLVHEYTSKSQWYRANDPDSRARARPLLKKELHRLALSTHARAQKEKDPAIFHETAQFYRLFLKEFPEAKEARNLEFLLGETWMSLEAYADAGKAFQNAAYGDAEAPPDQKAAYAAVVAYEKVKMRGASEEYIDVSKQYARAFPKASQSPEILFNTGDFLFMTDAFKEAANVLENMITTYPKHRLSLAAKTLTAHSYMKLGDFAAARKAYVRAIEDLSRTDLEEAEDLRTLLAAAIYKQAENFKKQGEPENAALVFEAVSDDAPETALAPEALFEAALLYEGLKRPQDAIRVYQKIALNYASSDWSEKSNINAGLLFEKAGDSFQAAAHFVRAAESTPDAARAQELLWQAGLFYEAQHAYKDVINTFLVFIQRFPKHEDAPEALFKMAQTREKQGRDQAALKLYEATIQRAPKTLFAAKARFIKAEKAFERLKAVDLKKEASKKFKQKTRALKEAVQRYTETIESGHAEVVSVSAFRLGEVFEHFKSALLNAERPQNLNEAQMEEYLFQLEEKAYPFEEKAVKAYESNVQRIRQSNGSYTEWVKKSFDRLAELRPALYRRKERSERVVSTINPVLIPSLLSFGSKDEQIVQVK